MKKYLLPIIILICFASCTAPSKPAFKTIKEVKATNITASNITLKGIAVYNNPNLVKGTLSEVHIDVWVNEIKVGRIDQTTNTEIPANSDFDFPFEISFPPSTVFKQKGILSSIVSMIENKSLQVKYKGSLTFELLKVAVDVPVDYAEEVSLKRN